MTKFEFYSLIVGASGAVVTFLAILVAIWGEKLRQYWTAPELILKYKGAVFTTTNGGVDGWYYLLEVSNERRSSPAANVRVMLTRVFRKGPDGKWQERKFSGPSQVMWRWPSQMAQYQTIGPQQVATFAALLDKTGQYQLQLYHTPNNLERLV